MIQTQYLADDKRFQNFNKEEHHLRRQFVSLLKIDNQNISNTSVSVSWVGFPGWLTISTIGDMANQMQINPQLIHEIKALICDLSKPYVC